MDTINEELITRIEKVLNLQFYEWQRNYLLDKPTILNMYTTGRRSGKTTIYMIKQLFQEDKPIVIKQRLDIIDISDWWSVGSDKMGIFYCTGYAEYYMKNLKDLYRKLNNEGIMTRKIIFDIKQ